MGYTTVEIYCDHESHSEKRWVIERFAKMGDEWLPLPELLDGDRRLRRPEGHRAYIDRSTDTRADAGGFSPPFEPRDRYHLRCKICKRPKPRVQTQAETLNPIFDVLAEHSVSCIRIGELAARVSRSAGA
jgi:hypothetical protein